VLRAVTSHPGGDPAAAAVAGEAKGGAEMAVPEMAVPAARTAEKSVSEPGIIGSSIRLARDPIRFDRVSFVYPKGDIHAISDLSLSIGVGRTTGIVGPSGCGKSTLLALLAGLVQPTSGEVTGLPSEPGRHRLAMVFQKDTLLPWLTVTENIKLFARFTRVDKRDLDHRVKDLIKLVSLEGFEAAYPYQLSGGMKRRVAFLAAVASMPSLLLLDEPFSALDEPTRVGLHQDVIRITQQMDMTVLLVTHDLAEAASLCDEVTILTARPATVASQHAVDFGPDRDVLSLRKDPEFLRLYGVLWSELAEQIRSGQDASE
jgi:NitT/TauT family transport system ATP-binding protein